MKRYLAIFNSTTLVIIITSLSSCFVCHYFQLSMYIDFLIMSLVIFFPLTLSIKVAFRRREKALQYLSLFKASIQSVFYSIQNSKLDKENKDEFRIIAIQLTDALCGYLKSKEVEDTGKVLQASEQVALFVNKYHKQLKSSLAHKILLFLFRLNNSVEFLLATKRHGTPVVLRYIVLVSIFFFAIFYPPSLLNKTGTEFSIWQLVFSSFFKVLVLISIYNVQRLLEDPFNQKGTDGIRVNDFSFTATDFPHIIKKEKTAENEEEEKDDMLF